MKFLHVNTLKDGTGSAIAAWRLHSAFIEEGYASEFFCMSASKIGPGVITSLSLERVLVARFYRLIQEQLFKPRKSIFSSAKCGRAIGKLVRQRGADILVVHWVNDGFIDFTSLEQVDVPVILVLHDSWAFTGGCHVPDSCEGFKHDCSDCPKANKKRVRKEHEFKSQVFRRSNIHIVAPSSQMQNYARNSSMLRGKRVCMIPHPLHAPTIETCPKRMARTPRIIFGAMGGVTNPQKGFAVFREAILKLADLGISCSVVVFGDKNIGEGRIDHQLVDWSVAGILSESELDLLYASSDVLVISSVSESYCQVLVEAMRYGVVPVSFDVGVARDLISQDCGVICQTRDADALVEGIRHVFNYLPEMSKKCSDVVADQINNSTIVNKYVGLVYGDT